MSEQDRASDRAGATLTIDLDAVAANWRLLADRLAAGRGCGAAVKADAYGLGAARVVPALAAAGCRNFFVATIDEGIAIKPLAGAAEVYVLHGPFAGTEDDFAGHGLIPVLNTPEQVSRWAAFTAGRGRRLPCAIHCDTGMNRLGLTEAEAAALAADAARLAALSPALLMSHLACADSAAHPANAAQLAAFRRLRAAFPPLPASLANSAGIFLGTDYHFDLARPGAALYGVNPCPGRANPMRQVIRLQGKILQVREIDSPMTVGYGAAHRVRRKGRIATVAVGYADGYLRSLGGRGHGHIGGVRVPVVGRVSMDLITFDVTATPPHLVHAGAVVDLIGPEHPVDALAEEAGTIGYEILTSLGGRYRRVHLGGQSATGRAE